MRTGTFVRVAVVAMAMLFAVSVASAQLNSGAQTIALNANLAESLTLSLSANSVNFTLSAGSATNAGSANITATTKWVLKPGRTAVGVYAYFASASAALTGTASGSTIPSSAFSITDTGAGSGGAGTSGALSNTVAFGVANSGLQMANVSITGANKNASRTDQMAFNIDLSGGTLPQLPADTYTGTLNIQAQATP
ncbi:MAG TPA: hypothetical protein VN682_01110 [Terriglobales bacterium]|nr:hypothetical protein [Terriglobales bacterium]